MMLLVKIGTSRMMLIMFASTMRRLIYLRPSNVLSSLLQSFQEGLTGRSASQPRSQLQGHGFDDLKCDNSMQLLLLLH
jgi:hypothetical protein